MQLKILYYHLHPTFGLLRLAIIIPDYFVRRGESKIVIACAFSLLELVEFLFSGSVVSDSATPWTAARQASLSIANSWSLLKLMSIESVMPSNHLILCCPLLLMPSVFPSIRVFSSESVLCIRWPKY